MATFKLRQGGFIELRKAILARLVLFSLVVSAGMFTFLMFLPALKDVGTGIPLFFSALVIVAWSVGIRKGIQRQRIFYESFLLTIEDDAVTRSAIGYPLIRIPRAEIRSIHRVANAFTIHGKQRLSPIIVPSYIEAPDQVEELLARFVPVQHGRKKKHWRLFQLLLMILGIASMVGIVGASNKWVIALSAAFLFPILIASLIAVFRSKNLEHATKRNRIPMFLMLFGMAAITLFKLTAPSPTDALLAYVSRLAPGTTAAPIDTISCSGRIIFPSGRQPRIAWASADAGSYDGVLANVVRTDGPDPADPLIYFHWNVERQMMVLFLHEDTVMTPTAVTWNALLDETTSLRIFGSDLLPLAQIDLGAWQDEGSGIESDAVTYYRHWDGELYEYSEPLSVAMPDGDACWFEDPVSLDDWLEEIARSKGSIGPTLFGPSEMGEDPTIRQFLEARQ